jgi:Tfp pilus assembly protein PilN
MSAKLNINLASEPFARTRAVMVLSGAAGVFLLGLLGVLISLAVSDSGKTAGAAGRIALLEARLRTLSSEQAKMEAVLRKPENAEVLERNLFLNNLIFAKGISWTRLFDDLEKVLPHNVRLIQIRPQVTAENEVELDMVVGAESSEPVIQMLRRMESSSQFGKTLPHSFMPPSQSEPLLRYRVSVSYVQKL